MPQAPHYIMRPSLFENLKLVSGFTNSNGHIYTDHICIIFNSFLSTEQKKIIKSKNTQEALDYLKTIVKYTHEY